MSTALFLPNRLIRFSRAMVTVTTFGIAFIALAMTLVFIIPDWTRNLLLARLGQAGVGLPLTSGGLIAGAAVTAVPIGVLLYGLWQVRALFRDFALGRVFTVETARRLQLFAGTVFAQAVLGPLSSAGLLLAFSSNDPAGTSRFGMALSTDDYLALIVGGVLLAIAWAMREAAQMADENASFV
jgi:Protein of unknown function (DUF2975)